MTTVFVEQPLTLLGSPITELTKTKDEACSSYYIVEYKLKWG